MMTSRALQHLGRCLEGVRDICVRVRAQASYDTVGAEVLGRQRTGSILLSSFDFCFPCEVQRLQACVMSARFASNPLYMY